MLAASRSLLLAVLLSLVACAPGQAPAARAPAAPAAPPAASAPPAAPAAPAAQPVVATDAKPAWQAEWDRIVAAARQEGSVVVNGPAGDTIRRAMVDGFQKAHPGITVEWTGGAAPEMVAKMEAERRAGLYAVDVLIAGTSVQLAQVKPLGAWEPLRPALLLPEVTDPASWLDGRLEFADNEGENDLVFITVPMGVIAYNPSMVKPEEIDELPKLLDPKWRGKIVVSDPVVGGSGQALFRFFWAAMGPDKAADYIRAIKAQAGTVDRDRRRMVEWIARGRYPILLNPDGTILPQLKQEGLIVETLPEFKDVGTYVSASFGSVSLINHAPSPNAAKVFVNWLLTKDGQTAYSTATRQASRRLDVPRDHLPPDQIIRPDGKYWASYKETEAVAPPELVNLLNEVFAR